MPQGRARASSRRAAARRRPPVRYRRRRRRGSGRRRLLVLLVASVLAFLAISGRLIVLQVLDAGSLDQAAARQRQQAIELPATRGRVFDRNGGDLALSVPARIVYAQPRLVRDKAGTARRLAPLLHRSRAWVEGRLRSDTPWVYLARRLSVGRGNRVTELKLPGIGVIATTARRYPSGKVAAQVLGFVGDEGRGLAGVEQQYDALLRGHPGQVRLQRDPHGRAIPQVQQELERAVPGSDVVLTIDQHLQYVAEQSLATAVRRFHARAGSVLVMDPRSGEVLAMANLPTFDPNRFASSTREGRRNRAVTDVYEPGSTNKTLTAAAALQHGVVTPRTPITVPPALELCPGVKTFHDAHEHGTEVLSFAEVVAQSSNIGTIQVAKALGPQRLARAELDFGYGRRTGIDLPGESPGIVLPGRDWRCTDLGVNAIGQGVAVTVLQMASVYATVANGGVLMAPTLLRGTVDATGRFEPSKRRPGRRVLSARTARALSRILEGVVKEGGTGTLAALDEWRVAGKTGTARKPDPERRGYLAGAYVSSFIGFAPAERPAAVVAVVLDQPTPIYGGVVAAPVFREVTGTALRRLGVLPTLPPKAVR
ncbi:MAG TPA: penicillin-binding protein 2 [Actinomycetes bacterium]|nr:penicillin-binding protein 2 [Actinomycetes bacterium]